MACWLRAALSSRMVRIWLTRAASTGCVAASGASVDCRLACGWRNCHRSTNGASQVSSGCGASGSRSARSQARIERHRSSCCSIMRKSGEVVGDWRIPARCVRGIAPQLAGDDRQRGQRRADLMRDGHRLIVQRLGARLPQQLLAGEVQLGIALAQHARAAPRRRRSSPRWPRNSATCRPGGSSPRCPGCAGAAARSRAAAANSTPARRARAPRRSATAGWPTRWPARAGRTRRRDWWRRR